MAEYRSLYSVIPARVRDDKSLRPNAKLLYGELSTLAYAEGYCWASNAYLAELFDLAPKTVEALIKQLKDRGHIQIEVERDKQTNEVLRRKIWICGPPGSSVPPPLKNEGRSPQNQGDPPLKIEGKNNINNNTSNIPPIVPPEGDKPAKKQSRRREPKQAPDWKPERFEGFWALYPLKKSKQAAIRAWDRLKPDNALLAVMGRALQRQIASDEWQRGFGIPYPATWINGQRWTDEDKHTMPMPGAPPKRSTRACHTEMKNGEEVVVYDD